MLQPLDVELVVVICLFRSLIVFIAPQTILYQIRWNATPAVHVTL